ncbi:MAG: DNA-binding protein WhiA [Bacillota bacterium]
MSFSQTAKNDLARLLPERRCCQLAELNALIRMDGTISIGIEDEVSVAVTSENAAVSRKIFKLFKILFGLHPEITIQRKTRLRKNNMYTVWIPPREAVSEALLELGLAVEQIKEGRVSIFRQVQRQCCRRAYLRGAFLGGGSVTNPEGEYHLEIVVADQQHAEWLARLITRLDLEPKLGRRKHIWVIYLKESDLIIEFLNVIGAHSALLRYESARVYKEMRNRVNRLVNCETANLNKTINASLQQLENIKIIAGSMGLDHLPDSLNEVARLRLEYPDVCLKELGEMMHPRMGKSGVNHRMRRIGEIADKIRNGNNL